MKRFLILLPLCVIAADDVTDLGVVSPRKPIVLERADNRPDFKEFIVVIPKRGEFQTNDIRIVSTNGVLRVNDELRAVYPGKQAMTVVQTCLDGEESEPAMFTFHLARARPHKPTAARLSDAGELPPLPTGFFEMIKPKPLPNGTNLSFQEYRARVDSGKRRNQ